MSVAQRVFHGNFGRVALLNMNNSLVMHAHSECHVLVKVAGDDTFFNVRGRQVPLTDRNAVLVNAWEPHYFDYQAGAGNTLILALYIEPAWLATAQQSLALSSRPDFFAQSSMELSTQNRNLADRLIAEMHSLGLVPQERIEFYLFDLLIQLIEDSSQWRHLCRMGARTANEYRDARVRKGTEYLLNHLDDLAPIDNAAKFCGLSRAHFYSLFRKETGMTPNLLLNATRMQRAFSWLDSERSGTLGLLSESLGFSEQGHFTRFFKHHIGASPSQYQRVVDSYPHS
jgi:AraC-like DNA-binding protein